MIRFGFFPNQPRAGSVSPPPGYAAGSVRIGDLDETVFSNLSIWTVQQYLEHWRQSAVRCIEEHAPVLFCTDLTVENVCVFAAFPASGAYDFEEWVMPRKHVEVRGASMALRRPRTSTCFRGMTHSSKS